MRIMNKTCSKEIAERRSSYMENSYRFFANKECQYYPCHKGVEELNCLFCYCPFYLTDSCPGRPEYIDTGDRIIKDCTYCTFPHVPENYDKVLACIRAQNAKREFPDSVKQKAKRKQNLK